jgi:hypothetical protein
MGSLERAWNQEVKVNFVSERGKTYRIERSTDLQSWAAIREHIPGNGGQAEVSDESAPDVEALFYRAVEE